MRDRARSGAGRKARICSTFARQPAVNHSNRGTTEGAALPTITTMDRARLIALLMVAAAITIFLVAAAHGVQHHSDFHPGGMNDGGYW